MANSGASKWFECLLNGSGAARFLSVAAFVVTLACIVFISFDVRKNRTNTKRHLLLVAVSLVILIWLWLSVCDAYNNSFSLVVALSNLVASIRMFGFNIAFSEFAPCVSEVVCGIFNLNRVGSLAFKIYITLIYFMAPAAGAAVILEFIVNIFARLKLKIHSVFASKEIYYFNALNKKSLALAKSICKNRKKRAVIVFSDVYTKKDEEESSEILAEARISGGICLKEDILHLKIRRGGKKTFVFIDDVGQKNIQDVWAMMDADKNDKHKKKMLANANVLVFCRERYYSMVCEKLRERAKTQYDKNAPDVRTIDEYSNLVKNVLKQMPLYEPLVGRKDANELQLTIVGSGQIGTEIFLASYWYGQLLGISLNINVVSKESETKFFDKINYINPEILSTGEYVFRNGITAEKVCELFCEDTETEFVKTTADYKKFMVMYPGKKMLAKPYFKLRYYQTDICDDDVAHKLCESHWKDGFCLKDTDYFVVALGADAENIQVSEKLNKYISEYHLKCKIQEGYCNNTVISCAVYDSSVGKVINDVRRKAKGSRGVYVYAFGSFDEVYDEENIYMRSVEKRSESINRAYETHRESLEDYEKKTAENVVNGNSNMMQYNYWASIGRALHLRYKVFSAGMINESVFTCGTVEKREELNKESLKKYYRSIKQNSGNAEFDKKLVSELKWLEHRRWNAFTRTMGFTTPDDFKAYAEYTHGYDHKEMHLKMHLFLTESDKECAYENLFETDINELDGLDSANIKLSEFCKAKADELKSQIAELEKMLENCNDDKKEQIQQQIDDICVQAEKLIDKSKTNYKIFDGPCEDFAGVCMTYEDKLAAKSADISEFYKQVEELKLPVNVYLPEKFNKKKKYKTVIAIHGGGWYSLKKTPDNWDGSWMANNVKYYAEKGYVGIVFSYRDINFTKDCHAGELLQDCRDAIKYISDNFSFADVKNAVLMGDSAGGHLALCLGMGLFDGSEKIQMPKKIVAYNPVTDCVCDKWNYCAPEAEKYSPLHNIKPVDASILVMHGNADTVVDINDSRKFTEKMKKAGNDISLIEIPDAKHAFVLFGYTAKEEEILNALKLTDEYFGL